MQIAKNLGEMENYSIYMLNGKMGLAGSPNGEKEQRVITEAMYNIIYPFIKGCSVVKKGKYYGVINKYGDEIIPSDKYVYLRYCEGAYFNVKDAIGSEYNIDANNNPIIVKDKYESIKIKAANIGKMDYYKIFCFNYRNGVFRFEYEGKVYLYNNLIEHIIYKGKKVRFLNDNLIVAQDYYTNKYGIIDNKGNTLTPFIYDAILDSSSGDINIPDNLFDARKEGKEGYIDYKGHIKIPFLYQHCGTFQYGYAWVTNDRGKCGLINTEGEIIEPLIHDNILFISNTLIIYIDFVKESGEKYTIKDAPRDWVKQSPKHVHFEFNTCRNPGYVLVTTKEYKKGITGLNGDIIVPAEYDSIKILNSYDVLAKLNGKWGIINLQNKVLHPFEFEYIDIIREVYRGIIPTNWYVVGKNKKFGIIDNNFNECLPIIYDGIEYSKQYDCYLVRIDKEKAMVDICNNVIVPFTSDDILPY